MTLPKNSAEILVGDRIRDRRLQLGLKQADLAARIGISASYLNLIEHNRRNIGGKLLIALANVLNVEPQLLVQGVQPTVVSGLQDAAQDGSVRKALGDDAARGLEFAERFPGWARAITTQRERIIRLEALVDGLNDRLTHDPVLSETMHDVLSTVSAIRSTASILVGTPDLNAEWQHRFHANIDTESRRLAETSAAMAEHFEQLTRSSAAFVTPLEATQALFDSHDHHFAAIERDGVAAIETVLAEAPLSTPASVAMARAALEGYATRAERMPLARIWALLDATPSLGPDRISVTLGVPLGEVLMRLSELPAAPGRPDIGCVRTDSAGGVLVRKPLPGFALPRFGAACNLWPVFAAFSTPGQPIRQTVITPEGATFTTYAVAEPIAPGQFDASTIYHATMIMVAGAEQEATLRIGSACRVCPREACAARREPSIIDSFAARAGPE